MPEQKLALKNERVDIDGEISIVVPKDCFYQIYGSESESTGKARPFVFYKHKINDYYLENYSEDDQDFPFSKPESFVISEIMEISVRDNEMSVDDLSNQATIDAYNGVIDQMYQIKASNPLAVLFGMNCVKPEIYLKSKDILVYTDPIDEEETCFNFTLFTSRYMYIGQVRVNDTESGVEIDSIINSWFSSIKLSRKKTAFKPNLKYNLGQTAEIEKNTILPVPDGYKFVETSSTIQNKDWKYIVPEKYALSKDHIDAKPFSIAVSKNSNSARNYITDERIVDDVIEQLMQDSPDLFDDSLSVFKHIISKCCALIYQLGWDGDTYKWCKIKGVIVSGENLYQFHAYENYKDEIAFRFDIQSNFESEIKNWADNIIYLKDKQNSNKNHSNISKRLRN